ncbi:MAG: extracellular solute-binding protein [Anaeroplasmataceae bacterium]|nr:extracellular solute-binding protein [Anaeroplasmataceae bacterium]
MKARKFLLASLTAGLALTVASCGGGSRSANFVVPEEGFNKEKDLKISFYHTMGKDLQATLQAAIDKFEADYPHVKVDAKQVGGYDDVRNSITQEIPQGLEPNIAYCYPDHVALYNQAKAVVQLDNLINDPTYGFTEEQLADFIPGYYEEGRQFGDGFMYTLPFSKSTEVLYYNKTEFDKNDWEVPTTWQEMMALCENIKLAKNDDGSTKYPNIYPLGIDSEANLFITLCEQTGSDYTSATGNHFLFDNAANRSYVEQFREWFKAGNFTTQKILTTYTSSLFTAANETAYNSKETDPEKIVRYSLMSIGSTGGASHQYPSSKAFEVGVAPVPTWEGGEFKVISQGPSLCVFNKKDPQEVLASWIFMKDYLLTTDFQAAFSNTSGYNPVLQSTYEKGVLAGKGASGEDILYSDWLDSGKGTSADGLIALTAKEARNFIENYYTSPAFKGSSKARDQVGDLFIAVITDTKTTDKAFKDAIRGCKG